MGDRPNEAGSRKALPGVLGVRFSGDTGSNHRGLFGLRAAGANTLMKAYHVWSKGKECLSPLRGWLWAMAIQLRLDFARLSKFGVGSFFYFVLFRGASPFSPDQFRKERCDPHHSFARGYTRHWVRKHVCTYSIFDRMHYGALMMSDE